MNMINSGIGLKRPLIWLTLLCCLTSTAIGKSYYCSATHATILNYQIDAQRWVGQDISLGVTYTVTSANLVATGEANRTFAYTVTAETQSKPTLLCEKGFINDLLVCNEGQGSFRLNRRNGHFEYYAVSGHLGNNPRAAGAIVIGECR